MKLIVQNASLVGTTSTTSIDADSVQKMEEKMRKERADFQRQLNTKQSMIEEKELQVRPVIKVKLMSFAALFYFGTSVSDQCIEAGGIKITK